MTRFYSTATGQPKTKCRRSSNADAAAAETVDTCRVLMPGSTRHCADFRSTPGLVMYACGIIFTLRGRAEGAGTGNRNSGYTPPVIYTGCNPGHFNHFGKPPDNPCLLAAGGNMHSGRSGSRISKPMTFGQAADYSGSTCAEPTKSILSQGKSV